MQNLLLSCNKWSITIHANAVKAADNMTSRVDMNTMENKTTRLNKELASTRSCVGVMSLRTNRDPKLTHNAAAPHASLLVFMASHMDRVEDRLCVCLVYNDLGIKKCVAESAFSDCSQICTRKP